MASYHLIIKDVSILVITPDCQVWWEQKKLAISQSPFRRHQTLRCFTWWGLMKCMSLDVSSRQLLKRSGVTLCKLVEKSNCCEGDGVKAMFMVVRWKQEPVWEWPHWGSWQHSLSSFVNSKLFDVIETEQGWEIERAKVSTSVKVQSSVMQCEIAAEWALSV